MPAVIRLTDMSTGHGCFPPTSLTKTPIAKTFFNNLLAGVIDTNCQYVPHTCDTVTHAGQERSPSVGSTKTFIEGKAAARIGDTITCGDACAQGSPNSFIK